MTMVILRTESPNVQILSYKPQYMTLLGIVILIALLTPGSGIADYDAWRDLPPLQWEGDCPVEPECPESFRGAPPPLLLVSLDGFRAEYLGRHRTPTLKKLSRCGVRARFLSSVYPSKTFPNHFTQVTGLYPSSHGIIDNSMYDPDTGRYFKLGTPESFQPDWWQREPIWVSAEKQGKKTATFFWPGSDVRINDTRPTYYKNYSSKIPFEDRVLQVLQWLELPSPLRPAFLTLYFNEPDSAAHEHGTQSAQVDEALERVDRMVEALFSGLQARNLTGCVNVFLASDHGMADIDCGRVVDLREYINVSDVRATIGTFGRLLPTDNTTSVAELLTSLRCRNEHLRVFRKEELPLRMHYSDNPRIEPIILDTDAGWTIFQSDYAHGDNYCTGGAHGYDNLFPDMRALFVALGPSMRRNAIVEPFLTIELYELMCELIGITPNPNNGTRGSLHHLLRAPLLPLPPRKPPHAPATAEVPKDAAQYTKRIEAAQCPCKQSQTQVVVPEGEDHLPFGVPMSSSGGVLLRNSDYVLSYNKYRHVAEWAAFTVDTDRMGVTGGNVCWKGDARMEGANCASLRKKGLLQWPLYPPVFSGNSTREEAEYVTNSVPVSSDYATILGGEIWRWLEREAVTSHLHVVTGPVFAASSSLGFPVPSHMFVLATSCSEEARSVAECPPSKLRANAFLLPSRPFPDNCETASRVIERNAARVVDIEGATGLEFFSGLPRYDALRLRTALPSPLHK